MRKKIKLSISFQISIFLVIVAFMPIAIMMALKTYEKQLLSMMENSNVQQGRLVSSAIVAKNQNKIDVEFCESLLRNMNNRFDSRIRILDNKGFLLLDSAGLFEKDDNTVPTLENESLAYRDYEHIEQAKNKEPFLYRLFSYPIRFYRRYFMPPNASSYDSADYYSDKTIFDGDEVVDAINGNYGAKTRISSGGQISVNLYSAIPIGSSDNIIGVVLVNRSTYRILQNLYELRTDLGRILLITLIIVFVVAVFFALRISRPLRKLSNQTLQCTDKKGSIIFSDFAGKKRIDEIGDLSRSFSVLIEKLNKRIKFSQAFSSDISHEFKNPLAAIRTMGELLSDQNLSVEERGELSNAILDEVTHLQNLLNGIRKISKIDAGFVESEDELDLVDFTKNIINRYSLLYPQCKFEFVCSDEIIQAFVPQQLIEIVISNLIDNAASFGSQVMINLEASESKEKINHIKISVQDNGKGISKEQMDKIFERFYSERKVNLNENHTGLGLSIVKSVTDSLEGSIEVQQSKILGGADFIFQFDSRKSLKK